MCIKSMANDGGLKNVLQSAEQVADSLIMLSPSHNNASAGSKRKPSRSLSERSSNAGEHTIPMNLSQHTSSELQPVISPLIHQLEKLNAAQLLSLTPSIDGSNGANLDPSKGITIRPIHDLVMPQYHDQTTSNIVRYLHVKESHDKYSAGIFIFPPHAHIPLHDHPDMVVISRVLYGELAVQSYDVLSSHVDEEEEVEESNHSSEESCNDKRTDTSPSKLRTSFNRIKDFVSRTMHLYDGEDNTKVAGSSILQVKRNLNPLNLQEVSDINTDNSGQSLMISAPKVTCLYPHEGNCHSFKAGPNGAAVLDLLLPPYSDDDDRDCTFYKTCETVDDKNHRTHYPEQQQEEVESYTLTPIDQPEDFHCLGGSYGRFGNCNHG